MPRNADRNRTKKRAPSPVALRRRGKPKVCIFCRDHLHWVDYKDVDLLRRFLSDRAKIKARRVTGTCHRHQRDVATAVKTARELALLPYTQRVSSDKGGGRGGRGRGRGGPPPSEASLEIRAPEGEAAEVPPEIEFEAIAEIEDIETEVGPEEMADEEI
jgi:small subunit ribosomal protein S18